MQRRIAFIIPCVYICSTPQRQLRHFLQSILTGNSQNSVAKFITNIHGDAMVEIRRHLVHSPMTRSTDYSLDIFLASARMLRWPQVSNGATSGRTTVKARFSLNGS